MRGGGADGVPDPTGRVRLAIITGLSGAGKSHALSAFEDAGWFSIDNLPSRLLHPLIDLYLLDGTKVERSAIVCDVRGGEWFSELARELDRLGGIAGVDLALLFLTASDDVLLKRFSETRRRHPLTDEAGSVTASLSRERELLADLRARADVVIDTTNMNIWELRRTVLESMMEATPSRLQVTFTSFGFKHGSPRDADLVFDVRFLRNPHYDQVLAPRDGRDSEVGAFIAADPATGELMMHLHGLLDFLLPRYAREGKSHAVVAIGCTGGRHRSVFLAERLAARYRDEFNVAVTHRDVDLLATRDLA